jgi:hypothetical protein
MLEKMTIRKSSRVVIFYERAASAALHAYIRNRGGDCSSKHARHFRDGQRER